MKGKTGYFMYKSRYNQHDEFAKQINT